MGDFIATKRKSSLAVKLEKTAIATITADSSGTTVTFSGVGHGLAVGDVLGSDSAGFRTVVEVTDTTHVEVDSAYDVDLSTDSMETQSFGVDPTVAVGDVILFTDFSLEADLGEIPIDDVNRSFDENEPVLGSQTVGGNIEVSMRASGTPGTAPESDALWQCAFGEKSVTTAAATDGVDAGTATVMNVASGDGAKFKAGQHILMPAAYDGSSAPAEVTRIESIATDALTLDPPLSYTPTTGISIGIGVHYRTTVTELQSFWAQFYRGDITREIYKGNKIASLAIDFQSGQSVKAVFSVDGKEMADPVAGAYNLGAATNDSSNVHVARYMAVRMGGVTYPVSKVSLNMDNELFRREDVTGSGTKSLIRTKRTVTGSFELLYENKDIEAAFIAGTTAELLIVSSQGASTLTAGNIFAVSLPKLKYTKVPKSENSGLYSYGPTFKAVRTTGEDAIFASFL